MSFVNLLVEGIGVNISTVIFTEPDGQAAWWNACRQCCAEILVLVYVVAMLAPFRACHMA